MKTNLVKVILSISKSKKKSVRYSNMFSFTKHVLNEQSDMMKVA